jgi:hypothetical protein
MKTKLFILTAVSAVILLNACKKDEETPVVKVTYDADVKTIFVANCGPCHLTGGTNPNKWDSYTSAKNKIGVILERVKLDEGTTGHMPYGKPKLSAETIAVLDQWLADGLLEK